MEERGGHIRGPDGLVSGKGHAPVHCFPETANRKKTNQLILQQWRDDFVMWVTSTTDKKCEQMSLQGSGFLDQGRLQVATGTHISPGSVQFIAWLLVATRSKTNILTCY